MVSNFDRGQVDAADDLAGRILARDPQHLRALSVKGSVAAYSGEYRTALQYFQRAYGLDSTNRMLRRNLAYALLQSGQVEKALIHYEDLRDGSASAEYSYANALLGVRRFDDVLQVLQNLPNNQIPVGDTPAGQVSILYAAALMGRAGPRDRETAAEKLLFGVAQQRDYWLPVLLHGERDPMNDYQQLIRLLDPILEETLADE